MKLVFSLLLILSFQIQARELIIIHYDSEYLEDARLVKSSLVNQLSFPSEYLHLKASECSISKDAIATICVLENGQIEIKQQRPKIMRRLMAAFGEKL